MISLKKISTFMLVLAMSATLNAAQYRTLEWEALVPAGFNLAAQEDAIISQYDEEKLMQDEALGQQLDAQLQMLADTTPVVDTLNKVAIKIPGFVVPLELEENKVRSFLLVPYYGACIHMPPPPANQVILVTVKQPFVLESMFDPVWVAGTMEIATQATRLGVASYQLTADLVEDYNE